jgi:hypothetical protein
MRSHGPRPTVVLPIKIQSGSRVFLACTLNVSNSGIKVQTDADLRPQEEILVCHGVRKMKFRVVWTRRESNGLVAGLVSLVQPLSWAQVASNSESRP